MTRSLSRLSTDSYRSIVFSTALIALLATSSSSSACDICAVYIATEVAEGRTGFRLSVAEQFSRFTTAQRGGTEVSANGERLNSSITQFVLGYQFTDRFALQANLPFIARAFRRLENDRLTNGDAIGIGDMSLIGTAQAFSRTTDETVFRVSLTGGLKLPTGNSGPLAEEFQPETAARRRSARRRQQQSGFAPLHESPGETQGSDPLSAVRGHDFALGSGSVDGIVGAQLYWAWNRVFLTAGMQYAARTEGDFEYRFADDITWQGGPGYYVLLDHRYTLGLFASVAGETKGNDVQQGRKLNDSAITALYVGPGAMFSWGTSLSIDFAADLPAFQNNTGLQLVPDYRLRAGLTWRF